MWYLDEVLPPRMQFKGLIPWMYEDRFFSAKMTKCERAAPPCVRVPLLQYGPEFTVARQRNQP